MNSAILTSLVVYALTIVFALLIALVIQGMGVFIKKLGLDRSEEPLDLSVPSANAAKEEEALAVAIAVVHAHRR